MKEPTAEQKKWFILQAASQALSKRDTMSLSWYFEAKLWDIAASLPQGDASIITTNEKGYDDPYLLRVYLTPSRQDIFNFVLKWAGGWYDGTQWDPWLRLAQKAPRAYLHYFFRGDDDRAVHSHPWQRSVSLILLNGYVEHRFDRRTGKLTTRTLRAGDLNYIRRDDFHKVELLPGHGTWTLFVSTERTHESDGTDWEFMDLTHGIKVPWGQWNEYNADKIAWMKKHLWSNPDPTKDLLGHQRELFRRSKIG